MPNTPPSASFTLLDFRPQLLDLYLGDARRGVALVCAQYPEAFDQ